ncbi:MAG: glycine-rich protein [Thermomicrobiales bacterium]
MRHIHGQHNRFRLFGVRFGALFALICGALLLGLAGSVGATGPCTTSAGLTTCTFDYTGAAQTWTVPDGVTQVTLDVFGAQGGYEAAQGGQGGRATATVAVTPGETLTIVVGGVGHSPFNGSDALGGFNGGGNGGAPYNLPTAYYGSGGGGASDVRIGGTDLAQRAIVAGGGGGAADVFGQNGAAFGGAGGGLNGGAGNSAYLPYALSGGAGGNQDGTTGSGQLGLGSAGVDNTSGTFNGVGAGGGGGGYFGGAGGPAGTGGGGGSGFGPAGTVFAPGVRTGDGQVVVTYTPTESTPPTTTIALAPAAPDGSSGWYIHQPTVTVGAVDNAGGSGVAATRCVLDPASVPGSFADLPTTPCPYLGAGAAVADGAHTVYAASIDNAGNAESPVQSASFQVDTSPPQDAPVVTGTLGTNGWYMSDVSVAWHWSDAPSGIATGNCPQSSGSGGVEGLWNAAATCYDVAGNHQGDARAFMIEMTPPTVSPSLANGTVFAIGAPAPTVSPNASDPAPLVGPGPASGIASASCGAVSTVTVGTRSVACTATDQAGNTTTVSRSYTVGYGFGGFISPLPIATLATSSSTIPVKFTLQGASGPLDAATAQALAMNHQVQAILYGPGATGPIQASAPCTWDAKNLFFQCNIKTPKGLLSAPNQYFIVVQETLTPNGAASTFFTVPGAGNPEPVSFK